MYSSSLPKVPFLVLEFITEKKKKRKKLHNTDQTSVYFYDVFKKTNEQDSKVI